MESYKKMWRDAIDRKGKTKNTLELFDVMASQLFRIGVSVFEWKGIDDSQTAFSRKIEEYLLFDKKCAIVDSENGLIVTRIVPTASLNIYGEPTGYEILTENGETNIKPKEKRIRGMKGTIGYDNAIILTDSNLPGRGRIDGVSYWLRKYADVQESLDQQMINQRSPLMTVTKTKGQKIVANTFAIDTVNGMSILGIDEELDGRLKALNIDSKFNVDRLNAIQHEYESRALECFGVDSMQAFGKKERMIVDEVESNDEKLSMILADSLSARRKPLSMNYIAKKYNISVDIAVPYRIVGGARIQGEKIIDQSGEQPDVRIS